MLRTRLTAVTAAVVLASAAAVAAPSAPAAAATTLTMRGADVSSLQRSLDLGARYYNAAGTAADPFDILKGLGVNYVRLTFSDAAQQTYFAERVLPHLSEVSQPAAAG